MPISLEKPIDHHRAHSEKPLLSNSSILILSGFLLGMVITDFIPPAFRVSAILGGTVGVIAFFSLGSVSRARAQQEAALKDELETVKLEGKVLRHVRSALPSRKKGRSLVPTTPSDRQYVTVPGSRKC